jgi:hypothetical protein
MKLTIAVPGVAVIGLALFLAIREGGKPEGRSTVDSSADLTTHAETTRVSGPSHIPLSHAGDPDSARATGERSVSNRSSVRPSGEGVSTSSAGAAEAADRESSPATGTMAGTESDPASKPAVPEAVRRAADLRKQLLADAERVDELSGNAVFLQPAVWVDLGDDSQFPEGHPSMIQAEAEALKKKITESGLDPSSPEYRKFWNQAVRESDWKFRARYGARAWTKHHLQAHHLSLNQKD